MSPVNVVKTELSLALAQNSLDLLLRQGQNSLGP